MHPQFLVDETGKRRSVVLSIEEFEGLMELVEDLNDAAALDAAVAGSSGLVDFDAVVDGLKRDGRL
jgi:hypothetical protein